MYTQCFWNNMLPIKQQVLLRQTLAATGWTRNRLAAELLVTKRCLDSWMLPSESRQSRKMELPAQHKVMSVLTEASKSLAAIKGGRRKIASMGEPLVFCEQANIHFPTLYRSIGFDLDADALKRGLVKNTNTKVVAYSLDPAELRVTVPGLKPPLIEPISHLDPAFDLDCVSIMHLRNQDEATGFLIAACQLTEKTDYNNCFDIYEIDDNIFALIRFAPAAGVAAAKLLYRARFSCGGLFPESCWSLTVMPDGTKELVL